MSARAGEQQLNTNPDRVDIAEYVAKLVAAAPPISEDARAKLAALLGVQNSAKGAA